ncbi:CPA_1a_G0047720.mRNA.1.CDS.1 [Saccharomyces cerevisiae]|nr:CPA_1a_G0047720.mRNA.1.CDS.1 [Saccharomyces cerevisiae]CAI7451913.1 CPA_1a_G0047720.mRNA.1.CDS.1 [Saccharomyces cerevisiae]
MSKLTTVSVTSAVAPWTTKATFHVLRCFQVCLSVTNLFLASFAIITNSRVDRILRLSLAVSIISSVYFGIVRFLPVLLVFAMEIVLTILWFTAFVTLASKFGSMSCSNMPRGINFDFSGSCRITKMAILPEVVLFILFLATTYVSYFKVLSQARESGTSTRFILKACVKTLRDIVERLESSLEEGEPLLDLEVQGDAKVESEDIESSTVSEDNALIEPDKKIDSSIEPSEC